MKRILTLIAALCCIGVAAAQKVDTCRLRTEMDDLVRQLLPKGSEVGICVYDLTDKTTVYDYRADKLARPASTMKLLTAITALSRGANEPFRTEVWTRGTLVGDTLDGDLYVVGGFDPELDEEALDSLVQSVARAPFKVVRGHIYGDVSLKDSLYWGHGWLWDDNPASFQPYLSPLMLCKGVLTVKATPGERGETASLECVPASSYYTLTNETRSRTPSAGRFGMTRNWLEGGNHVVVKGNVDVSREGEINLARSQDFFMHTFAERIQQKGVACTTPGYAYAELQTDSLCTRIATHTTSMQAVLNRMLKASDNLNAEAVLCRLGTKVTGGRHVSADDGLAAIAALIRRMGHDPQQYRLADGCGLSNYNYISPELLVAFLRHAYARTAVFQRLYKALPTAGVDGTLRRRMTQGSPAYKQVYAKTGSFTGISCLAGYLKTSRGRWMAFAIMNQNVILGREARRFQDKVCETLMRF